MADPNYYEILQISATATLKEIKTAFRRLARLYHPDVNSNDPTAAEKFKKICQAYEVLGDPQQRHQYDQQLPSYSSQTSSVSRNDQTFYEQGLKKAKEKDYTGAIVSYTQAIQVNPLFWEAYLQRCKTYYQLFQDKSVLEDCQRILQLNPGCSQAYYYLGLSRQRLGYTQSAIQAYTQAIQREANYAQAYYRRGLAYEELKIYVQANKDLQASAELFRQQGDLSRYRLVQEKRDKLFKNHSFVQKVKLFSSVQYLAAIFSNFLKSLWLSLIHPREGLIFVFLQLEKEQAFIIGILSGIITALCLSISWQNWLVGLSFIYLITLGIIPFFSIALSSYLIRFSGRFYGYIAGDVFLGGLTILPISLIFLILSNLTNLAQNVIVFLQLIAVLYTGLILYNGYIQISNFPPKLAFFMTSLILIFITLIFYVIYSIKFFS